jgi:AraC family transcriptional regulator of adaptative response / DNA-3-methyladenine glycosylase II
VILQSAAALGLPGTARGLAAHGERWAPWRSYAALHLWRARPVTGATKAIVSSQASVDTIGG